MSDDIDDLRNQTEHTREQLAQTVEALAQKADVKGRAKETLADYGAHAKQTVARDTALAREKAVVAKDVAKDKAVVARTRVVETQQQKPWALPAVGGALLATLVAWIVVRRRS